MTAISEALTILGFWEMPEDEQPDERILGNDEALVAWFEEVKTVREAKYSGKPKEHLEEVPLMSNEVDLSMF